MSVNPSNVEVPGFDIFIFSVAYTSQVTHAVLFLTFVIAVFKLFNVVYKIVYDV